MNTPCPTCSGPIRETRNHVCQRCGTDYGADARSSGLIVLDDLAPTIAACRAWSEDGPYPAVHRRMQMEVRKEMPLLARALDRMVLSKAARLNNKKELI